jgi:hypothetical protein
LGIEPAAGQHPQGSIHLTEVPSRPGDDDEQLRSGFSIQTGHVRIIEQAQCLSRATECSFRIRDHGEVAGISGDPPGRAQLAERLGPLLRAVGRDADRFPNDTDPSGSGASGARVLEGPERIVLEVFAGRGEVGTNDLGGRLRQTAQIGPHLPIQKMDGGAVWDGRFALSGRLAVLSAGRARGAASRVCSAAGVATAAGRLSVSLALGADARLATGRLALG